MRLEEVELPPPRPGEARVRHHAIGVNYLDVYYRTGFYPPPPYPFTPGNEGAGEVVAIGKGVKGFRSGDRVAYISTLGSTPRSAMSRSSTSSSCRNRSPTRPARRR